MKHARIENLVRGWFVGKFDPTVFETNSCEVALKKYKKGDHEAAHYHKVATEITVVATGRIRMVDREWGEGDIVVLEPGEVSAFEAVTDAMTVVVKLPGASADKFLIDSETTSASNSAS